MYLLIHSIHGTQLQRLAPDRDFSGVPHEDFQPRLRHIDMTKRVTLPYTLPSIISPKLLIIIASAEVVHVST